MEILINIFLVLFASVLSSRVLIPFLINHSYKIGLVDKPNQRKVHQNETPIIGGLGIMITLAMVMILFPSLELYDQHPLWFVSVLLIFFMALFDDRFELNAKIRLTVQFVAATLMAYSGIRIESMFGLFGVYEIPISLQYLLTVIVIVGVTNAYNLMDGIDGLVGSISLINFSVLGTLALSQGQNEIGTICFAIVGATITFLKYNFYPAKVFMGDAGSMSLGFIMISLSILVLQNISNQYFSFTFIVLASTLLIPVTDAVRVFLSRYAKRLSIFHPDKSHLHHLLLDQGFNHGKASWLIIVFHLMIIVGGGAISLLLSTTTSLIIMVCLQLVISKLFALDKMLKDWGTIIKQKESLSEAS